MNRQIRVMVFYLLVVMLAIFAVSSFTGQLQSQNEFSYTQFLELIEKGEISSAVISTNVAAPSGGTVTITLTDGSVKEVNVPDTVEAKDLLTARDIPVTFKKATDNSWMTSLGIPLMVAVVVVFLMVTIMNQQAGPD